MSRLWSEGGRKPALRPSDRNKFRKEAVRARTEDNSQRPLRPEEWVLGALRDHVGEEMGAEWVAVKQTLDCRTSLSFIFFFCRVSKVRRGIKMPRKLNDVV